MIYIDELLFLNFIIDYIIISTLAYIMKINVKRIRILLGCTIGELSIIYLFINMNTTMLWLFKLILGIIVVYTTFGFNDIKTFIKTFINFYIISFFLGGILYYFKNENLLNYSYYLLMIPIIMNIYKYFSYDIKNVFSLKYKVTIYLNNGQILYLSGYMDTANKLTEPYSNKKVIIINKKVEEDYFFVPYQTIDNSALLKCFRPKKVYIDGLGERKDIVVGIINKKFVGYNCLLNYKLMEE